MKDIAYYTAATLLIVLLMITMVLHVINYSGFNKHQKGWFISTFSAIMFCALAEFTIQCGFYDPIFEIPLTILTILQFSVAPGFAVLFAGALGLRHQTKIAFISFAFFLLLGVICAPFKLVFYFDPVKGYERGDFFFIYLITYFGSLIYLIVSLFRASLKFHHRDTLTIVMVLVILAIGITVMSVFELHIGYITVGISACVCYVFYNDLVQQDTQAELLANQQKISEMQEQIISRLANLIESRDTETGEHVARTSAYVKTLAEDAYSEGLYLDQIDSNYINMIEALSPLHDVGKILVSDKILRKPGKLTPEEFEEIKKHTTEGGKIVEQILGDVSDRKQVEFASDIATYHHERWDGNGYPQGLKGEEIPLSARIMAIADVFDALVSKRCYKEAMPYGKAFEIIEEESGTHFDPKLVEIFLRHKEKYINISNSINDKTN